MMMSWPPRAIWRRGNVKASEEVISDLARAALRPTPSPSTTAEDAIPALPVQPGARPVALEMVNGLRDAPRWMTFLLDVNVLIALIDPMHVHHTLSRRWFESDGHIAWATCPITENGALRIIGDRRYGNSPGSPAAVAEVLARLTKLSGHRFHWS